MRDSIQNLTKWLQNSPFIYSFFTLAKVNKYFSLSAGIISAMPSKWRIHNRHSTHLLWLRKAASKDIDIYNIDEPPSLQIMFSQEKVLL